MQLQHFSVNDGDGIRTIVFMAGCPLRCAWCANPEGQTRRNAMTHWAETEDILAELRHQAIFFRQSGGGVTFSGGEATAQPDFLREMVDALYDEGFSLAIETCGYFDYAQMAPTLRKMDTIFIDIKHIDPRQHHAFTGVDNALILQNIRRASDEGLPLVVRIPTRQAGIFAVSSLRRSKIRKARAGAAGSPLRHAERGAARTLDSHGGSAWH